ncbi:porin family protein [Thiocapsa bogorovii]|uniref:outer membrane protein transport protein n=1 Tax=Thiocapsa bogorovii TaxID=521689 RepID=UPI001E6445A3|nr:outer membrane protein transport protein [Thiocapsa bogorovii]UHD14748.1 outer membrane protein transport protein [Thiocapsa bogorovii]
MTGIDQQHVIAGLQVILPSVKFKAKSVENLSILPRLRGPVRGGNGGNAAEIAPIPSFFYVRPLSDRVRFGFSSTAPLGGGVDYGSDFVGRYALRDATLAGLAATSLRLVAIDECPGEALSFIGRTRWLTGPWRGRIA